MRRSWSLALAVSTTVALAGCGDKTPAEPAPMAQSPSASGAPAEVAESGGSDSGVDEQKASVGDSAEKYVPESAQSNSQSSGYPGGESASGYPSSSGYPGSSGYPSESGYGGNSGGGRTQGNDHSGVILTFASLLGYPESTLSVSGNPALDDNLLKLVGVVKPGVIKEQSLEERAKSVFEAGNSARAADLLIASALLGAPDASAKLADQYRWNTNAKKPVLGTRIAIGLNLVNTANLTDLRPIGTSIQALSQRVNANSNSGGSSSESSYPGEYGSAGPTGSGPSQPNISTAKPLTDATGEFSKSLIDELNKSYAEGVWGVAFQNDKFVGLPTRQPGAGMLNPNGSFSPANGYESGAYPYQNGGGPAVGAISQAASNGSLFPAGSPPTGIPTEYPPAEASSQYPPPGASTGYGSNAPSGMFGASQIPGGPQPGGPYRRPPVSPADMRLPIGVSPVGTSVDFIGADSQSKLLQLATSQGYDVLVIYDVEVTLNRRNGIVSNTARAKTIALTGDPKAPKNIGASKPLNSIAVAKARSKDEADGLAEATQDIVKKTVEATKVTAIPANLTADGVVNVRVPRLLQDESISKLGKLGEVSFYYEKGYIDIDQRNTLFNDIAGRSGQAFISGSAKEKNEAIAELLR